MKTKIFFLFFIITASVSLYSCKLATEPENGTPAGNAGGSVTLNGAVVDNNTGNPIKGAVIRIISGTDESIASTDSLGNYSTTLTLDKSKDLSLIAVKEGYSADTTSIFATAGKTIDIPLFKLQPRGTGSTGPSGNPASIYLVSLSAQNIGVKESGSQETANLIFQVQDSSGAPIDAGHAVTVNFRIGAAPAGGEFISPLSAKSNALGKVSLNLTSGTKAGVIQIIAEARSGNNTISSKPVSISIHGGLPDQAHFSLAPGMLNIPGLNHYGILDPITVYVGDKYSNPVKPGTSVYFKTSGGLIEGSAVTNNMGAATVNLISAEPAPVDPVLGNGFAKITASTIDENSNPVSATTTVLFSGAPLLSVTPNNVDIPHLGAQTFNYSLKDQNGNPLSQGTTVTVTVDGDKLKSTGDISVLLPDTQSKSWTQFSFTVTSTDTSFTVRPVNINISTLGPNGKTSVNIAGTAK